MTEVERPNEHLEAVRLHAYRWAKAELSDLVDPVGHPCMWAVESAIRLTHRGDRVTVPMVRTLRDELMPDEYRAALAELGMA